MDKEEIISGRKESVGAWWDSLSLALPFLACMMSQKVSYDEDYHRGGLWCLLIHASSATTFEQKGGNEIGTTETTTNTLLHLNAIEYFIGTWRTTT